eukprot:8847878-Alexandrium_andersonii.AAC.1
MGGASAHTEWKSVCCVHVRGRAVSACVLACGRAVSIVSPGASVCRMSVLLVTPGLSVGMCVSTRVPAFATDFRQTCTPVGSLCRDCNNSCLSLLCAKVAGRNAEALLIITKNRAPGACIAHDATVWREHT